MKKTTLKMSLVFVLVVSITVTLFYLNDADIIGDMVFRIIPVIIGVKFLFNLFVRRFACFKPYFMSKYNIFTSKKRYQEEFDFSKDILLEKFKEILPDAGVKIKLINKDRGEVFAITPTTRTSWGENIYISLIELNGKTMVDFCSVCFFQVVSWGKNEKNYNKLLQEFESSLTI